MTARASPRARGSRKPARAIEPDRRYSPFPACRHFDGGSILSGDGTRFDQAGDTELGSMHTSTNLSDWHQLIWHFAEPAFREYKSSAWYVEKLRAEGFTVEAGIGRHADRFRCNVHERRGTDGRHLCRVRCRTRKLSGRRDGSQGPVSGLSKYAPGHTDPHSALGISALGGALAAKAAMQKFGIGGTLKLFGEPAEKLRASKPIHAAKGYYDGLDAAVSFHPHYMPPMCNTVSWDTHCGVGYNYIYTFTCDEPEELDRGRSRQSDSAKSPERARPRRDRCPDAVLSSERGPETLHAAGDRTVEFQRGDSLRRAGDGGQSRSPRLRRSITWCAPIRLRRRTSSAPSWTTTPRRPPRRASAAGARPG
jgi:hypothetical protein